MLVPSQPHAWDRSIPLDPRPHIKPTCDPWLFRPHAPVAPVGEQGLQSCTLRGTPSPNRWWGQSFQCPGAGCAPTFLLQQRGSAWRTPPTPTLGMLGGGGGGRGTAPRLLVTAVTQGPLPAVRGVLDKPQPAPLCQPCRGERLLAMAH